LRLLEASLRLLHFLYVVQDIMLGLLEEVIMLGLLLLAHEL
jgi:hypothetical protein